TTFNAIPSLPTPPNATPDPQKSQPDQQKPAEKTPTESKSGTDTPKVAAPTDPPAKSGDTKTNSATVANVPSNPAPAADNLPSATFDPDRIYQRLLKSTVLVMLHQNGRPVGNGSGGLVDKEHKLILTNHHVIREVLDRRCQASAFFPEYDKDGKLINAQK